MTQMRIPINVEYSVENTSSDLEELIALERKGVVSLQEEEYIRCKNCKELIDIRDFIGNTTVSCPYCDRQCGMSTSRIKKTAIVAIKCKKIINIVNTQIRDAFGKENVSYDKFERNWVIQHDRKKYLLYIYGISTVASFLSISENEGVILFLNEKKIRNQKHDLNESRYRYVFDPIFASTDEFIAFIDSLDFTETMGYLKFRDKFETFLASITNTQYEKEFIPQFIEGIKLKSKELSRLYSRLQRVENTILNTKCLKKGGPGLEDFYLIDLNKYLQDGLQPEKSGEAKKYRKTKFDYDDLAVAISHADHFKDTLFFVSTNDIAPSVWDKIMTERTGEGHFKYVIIDKDLMLMLLYNLDLIHLIDISSIKK